MRLQPYRRSLAGAAAALFVFASALAAQAPPSASARAAQAARAYRTAHQDEILSDFTSFLAIPNVAADPTNLQRNADVLVAALEKRHVPARLLTQPGVPPVVFGEIKVPGATHTIVFYAHYDGQPVTAADWLVTPPFTPILKQVDGEARIYARGAGDDKAAIQAQLSALDALQGAAITPRANLRFVWEGEEEAGSTHLEEILNANKEMIHGDVWLICDGPVDQSRQQSVVFGARGDTHLEITVYGPHHGLHSGHYGNWAPNPAMMLAQLLAGMKDHDGRVLIPNFYDDIAPLGPLEKAAIAAAPVNDQTLRKEFWLGHTEGGGKHLLELLNVPTLNVSGLSSAQTGAHAANVIPPTATASLDLRLNLGMDWRRQQDHVVDYVRSQGFFVVDADPDQQTLLSHPTVAMVKRSDGYNAVRTAMDLPIAKEVIDAVTSARGKVVLWPTMGGSVPLAAIEKAAATHTITVPIANHDDNQHSSDENLRLQNLWDGIETMAALMQMK